MLKKILELGVMVEPDALELLKDDKKASAVLAKLSQMKEKPLVLNKEEAEKLCAQTVLIKELKKPLQYSMHDIVGMYAQRYKGLQAMLVKKIDLKNPVSIKSAKGFVSIIGMKRGDMIEDPTGRIRFATEAKLLDEDVIGIRGRASREILYAEKVVLPDISLRSPAKAAMTITTGKDVTLDSTRFYDCSGVVVLCHAADHRKAAKELGIAEEDVPLELLKRRHLNNPPNDVIEPAPDIFLTTTSSHFVKNYKGTTIIGVPHDKKIEINLNNREIKDPF